MASCGIRRDFIGITLAGAIAYALFFYAIQLSGPVFASQCAYIVTVSGVIWGIIIFSEQHTLWVWTSVIVMMFGMMLVTPDRGSDAATPVEPATESSNA